MISIASTDSQGGPNLYPGTPWHRGFPPGPSMIDIALQVDVDGPFHLAVEDLETIAASLLLPWRDPPTQVRAQAQVIAEAYQYDQGLLPWRPGRRGITAPWVAGIGRLCLSYTPLMWRRTQVYHWLLGHPVPVDDWQPDPVLGITEGHVTIVRGPLWRAWEVSPVGVTEEGVFGAHPGARVRWRHKPRLKSWWGPPLGPHELLQRVLEACEVL